MAAPRAYAKKYRRLNRDTASLCGCRKAILWRKARSGISLVALLNLTR